MTIIALLVSKTLFFMALAYLHGKTIPKLKIVVTMFFSLILLFFFPEHLEYSVAVLLYISALSGIVYGLGFSAVWLAISFFTVPMQAETLLYVIPFLLGAFRQTDQKTVFYTSIALAALSLDPLRIPFFTLLVLVYLYTLKDMQKSKQETKQFESESLTDGLTHVYNKAYYEKTMPGILENANQTAFMFLDIDHFKAYNDTHGHNAGDVALRRYAMLFLKSVKFSDTVIRWGGEEFVVVLPDTTVEQAYQVALRLKYNAVKLNLRSKKNGQPIRNTISIGISTYPEPSATKESLEKNADAALYKAKKKRNDVIVFDQGKSS